MAVYGISKEGVDALKQLAADMSTLNNDIQECGQKLTAKVSGQLECRKNQLQKQLKLCLKCLLRLRKERSCAYSYKTGYSDWT